MEDLIFDNIVDSVTSKDNTIPQKSSTSQEPIKKGSVISTLPKPRPHKIDVISSIYSNHICHNNNPDLSPFGLPIDPSSLVIDDDVSSSGSTLTSSSSKNNIKVGIDDTNKLPTTLFPTHKSSPTSPQLHPIDIANSSLPEKVSWNWDIAQKCVGFMNMKKF